MTGIGGWRRIAGAALAAIVLAGSAAAQQSPAPLNTLNELQLALRACWVPPPIDQSRPGMQVTVRIAFKRNGELLGAPRITFETAGASDDERLTYRIAVMRMLQRCTPLPLSQSLGGAVAGRPVTIRLIDSRKLKEAGRDLRSDTGADDWRRSAERQACIQVAASSSFAGSRTLRHGGLMFWRRLFSKRRRRPRKSAARLSLPIGE